MTRNELLIGGIVALIVTIIIGTVTINIKTRTTVTDIYVGFERVVKSDGDGRTTSKWLMIFENEVFENTDTLLYGKFDSSDMLRKLKPGKKYKLDVYGFRIPFLSSYRNIIEVKEYE